MEAAVLAGVVLELVAGSGDLEPHPAKRDHPHQLHIGISAGADILGVGDAVLGKPHGRGLKLAEGFFERLYKPGGIACGLGLGDVTAEQFEIGADRAAAILGQLAPNQIHRLDAVGAFVDLGDAGVADELVHAPFADIAVAAENLLHVDRDFEPAVGEVALDHRGEQRDEVVGRLALLLGRGLVGEIDLERAPQHEGARALVEGFRLHQHAADVGVDEQCIGLGIRVALVGQQGAALAAVLGVGDRVLIGDFALGEALQADAEACRVHHDEHRGKPLFGLADEEAGGAVIVHDAG